MINRIRCRCHCHTDPSVRHISPCCKDGWIDVPEFSAAPSLNEQGEETWERGIRRLQTEADGIYAIFTPHPSGFWAKAGYIKGATAEFSKAHAELAKLRQERDAAILVAAEKGELAGQQLLKRMAVEKERDDYRKALELAECELKALYPRLGFKTSNILRTINEVQNKYPSPNKESNG